MPDQNSSSLRQLPRNVWATSITSFFNDISSEMLLNVLPFFLANVLGVRTSLIGLIEGAAESTASLVKLFSGWLSDRLGGRKWMAVAGYAFSSLSKPFFYFANSWGLVGAIRWADRLGKGLRAAPRDALVADSTGEHQRGLAFGFHRAADTGGAAVGLLIAILLVWRAQAGALTLSRDTFQSLVLVSLIPAFLAVLALAIGARDVPKKDGHIAPKLSFKGLGRPFLTFLLITAIFDLGNSSDAFLLLRAQERGLSVLGVLAMVLTFNLIYALVSTPAGALSDRVERRRVLIGGWLVYAAIYFGFASASAGWQVWILYALYGIYYGLSFGVARAMVADLVPAELRGTAYGAYNATLGIIDLPASLIAGVLWGGIGTWKGFGPHAPFVFGAILALAAAFALALWKPAKSPATPTFPHQV